jgi:hypothetical protein
MHRKCPARRRDDQAVVRAVIGAMITAALGAKMNARESLNAREFLNARGSGLITACVADARE